MYFPIITNFVFPIRFEMAYVGLISDTHGLWDPRVRDFLSPVDTIWHAGDFGTVEVFDAVSAFKPLTAVYGNCDGAELRRCCPPVQVFTLEGVKVLMMHIGGYPGRYDSRALQLIAAHRPDLFVCGHSHILKVMNDKHFNMLTLNPGAAGNFGFHTVQTALRFRIAGGRVTDMEVGEWKKIIQTTL